MLPDERRNSPRTKLHRLAYIHIEPDNGGIVLNVSGDGLAFHSMNAVERNGPVRFSLQEQNRRIDVCGKLIWTDEVQKIGGVRFTTLTGEARDQLRDWMSRPEISDEERRSSFGAAILRAFPGLGARRASGDLRFASYFSTAKTVFKARAQSKLSGFAGGLVTGFLVAVLAACVMYLVYGYRHQLGEALIHVGERLAQKSAQPPPAAVASQQPSVGPANQQMTVAPAVSTPPQSAQARDSTLAAIQSSTPTDVKPPSASKAPTPKKPMDTQFHARGLTPSPERASAPVPTPLIMPMKKSAAEPPNSGVLKVPGPAAPSMAFHHPPNAVPTTPTLAANREPEPPIISAATAAPPSSIPNGAAPPPDSVDVVHQASTADVASALQMFFDLGKFKQQSAAESVSQQVAQLGLRSSVVPRGHLWMNSYQVLVGPYTDTDDEKKINADLASHGYKPRPFERGSRGFAFRSKVTVERTRLPVGDCTISWESYVAEAKVKFTHDRDVVATTAKWAKRPKKFSENEYVYHNQPDGSRPLAEIHFAGLDRALVFANTP